MFNRHTSLLLSGVLSLLILTGMLTLSSGRGALRSTEIRMMSFNMHHGEDKWGESNLRNVVRTIQKYAPQVVALQAVDSIDDNGKVRYQLRQLAAQTGMHYVYGASDSLGGGTHGLGILSVFPIEQSQITHLPKSRDTDPRIMLCALLEVANVGSFKLCNARLEQVSPFDRAMQAAFVNRALTGSIQPTCLAIDMGAKPYEQPYFSFRDDWSDAAKGSMLPTVPEGINGDRRDYFFLLKRKNTRLKDYRVIRDFPDMSDHYPVLTTVEFY